MSIAVKNSSDIINAIKKRKELLREKYSVKRIGLFGSWITGESSPSSDIDILVDFEKPTFDNYMDLKFFLEDLFNKPIDLVLRSTLKSRIAKQILEEVKYAA